MNETIDTMASHVHKEFGCSEVSSDHIEYEWILRDFRLFSQENGEYIFSPIFPAKKDDAVIWKLQLLPRGRTKDDNNHVSLLLCLHSQDATKAKIKVHCELSIFKSESMQCKYLFTYTYEQSSFAWGFPKIIERSKLLNSCDSNGSLTIRCKIEIPQRIITKPVNPVSFDLQKHQLYEHFSQLLEDSKFCDVTIIVGTEKFRAHKLVLAMRSDVFAAMFEHKEMDENRKNEVKIEDMEPATVRGMLEFVYTDKVTNLKKLARDLLRASDKYELHRLRAMCEKVLYKTLTNDNAAEILVISDLYRSHKLKECVMAFIDGHLTDVTNSESFRSLVETHPALLGELISSMATRRK